MRLAKTQHGSSLLEVMVAILIVSIGLLSMASMVAASLQYAKLAQFQTIGAQLANAYADKQRANIDGFIANNYNQTGAYTAASSSLAIPTCAISAKCTALEIANIDSAEWTNDLRRRLPSGGAYVLRDSSNNLAADIWVMWADPSLLFNTSDLAVFGNGGDQCPSAITNGLSSAVIKPHCMYFRVTL